MADDDPGSPFAAQLPPDGGDGRHAGRIQQAESQQRQGGQGREDAERATATQQHGERGNHTFFRHEARNDGENAVLRIRDHVQTEIEGLQAPYDDRSDKDDRERPLQHLLAAAIQKCSINAQA